MAGEITAVNIIKNKNQEAYNQSHRHTFNDIILT